MRNSSGVLVVEEVDAPLLFFKPAASSISQDDDEEFSQQLLDSPLLATAAATPPPVDPVLSTVPFSMKLLLLLQYRYHISETHR